MRSTSREDFLRYLRLGLGRPFVLAQELDLEPLRAQILEACLHCGSYDVQVEGTRAEYMLRFLRRLRDRDSFIEEVYLALNKVAPHPDMAQRFRIIAALAEDGDSRARAAIGRRYEMDPFLVEAEGHVFLDWNGMEGFLFAASRVGDAVGRTGPTAYEGYLLSIACSSFGEEATWNALASAAKNNPHVAVFIEMARTPARAPTRQRRALVKEAEEAEGDPELIYQRLREEADGETVHDLGMQLMRSSRLRATPSREIEVLLDLYERLSCAHCRYTAVKRLLERNALPIGLRAECEHDAHDDIRDLVTRSKPT